MKMYRVEVFKGLEVVSKGHAFNAELIAKAILRAPDMRIGEVPFVTRGRAEGVSKAFSIRSAAKAAYEVMSGHKSVADYRDETISSSDKK